MKKLSLLRYFAFYSLISFLFTGVSLILFINRHMTNERIDSMEQITHVALDYIVEPELSSTDYNAGLSKEKSDVLDMKFQHFIESENVLGIKIWNTSNSVIYSKNDRLIETKANNNKTNLDEAFANNQNYLVSNDLVNGKAAKVIKIYLPIQINNSIVGVYEIIKPYDEIDMHMKPVIRVISIIVFSGLLILYLLLTKIMYNSSIKMLKQNDALIHKSNDLKEAYSKLNSSYKSTVLALSKAIDARDTYTAGHSERVTNLSLKIGQALNLPQDQLNVLEIAALFHDVGKIGIPDKVLNKPGKLTDEEFNQIKEHPSIGVDILKTIDFLDKTLPMILHHHEKYKGNGYPSGISGEAIPLESRIICVADSYDAMTSDRPYRKGLPHDVAVNELIKFKGIQFDTQIVDAFLKINIEE
jgi:HD-GYP domain-containing protein (c-di-GMP phosphodiesterase class II)